MPVMLALAFLIDAVAPPEACELRVWPAQATGARSAGLLSNLGMAGAYIDYHRHKESNLFDQVALIDALPPQVQAEALTKLDLPKLVGMPGAAMAFVATPLDMQKAAKSTVRQSVSTGRCYAELMITMNEYRRSSLVGRQLRSHIVFKDFRDGRAAAKPFSRKASNPLTLFPPSSPAGAEKAQDDLVAAFQANVKDFAAAKAKLRK